MSDEAACIVLSNVVDKAEEEDLADWLGDIEGCRLEQAALPSVWYLHLPAGADVQAVLMLDGTDLGGQPVAVRQATVAEMRALQDDEDEGEADGSASREGSDAVYEGDEPAEVEVVDAEDIYEGIGIPRSASRQQDFTCLSVDVMGDDLLPNSVPVQPSPLSPLPASNCDDVSMVGSSSEVFDGKEERPTASDGGADDVGSEPSNVARVGSPDSTRYKLSENDLASLMGDATSSLASSKRPRSLFTEDESNRSSKRRPGPRRQTPSPSALEGVHATPIRCLSQLPIPRLPATPIARRSGTGDREWTSKLEQQLCDQRRTAEVAFAQFNSWRTVAEGELKSQQAFAKEQSTRAAALEAEKQWLQAELAEVKATAAAAHQEMEARCEKQARALLTLREEMATAKDTTMAAQAKLLERLHTAEAEAARLQTAVADLERRVAEKPQVSEETLDLRDRVAQLEKENASLQGYAAREKESAEAIAQLKRELRRLLSIDTQLQRAQQELKRTQAEADRVGALEAELQAKVQKLAQLEETLQHWKATFRNDDPKAAATALGASRVATLEKELEEAKAERDRMTQQRDLLEVEIGRLEGLVGKGSFDPSTTKVLHCAVTPLAQGRIDALEAEVAGLQAGADATVAAQHAALRAELEAVKARLAQREKQQHRLLNEFQKQTSQYRESVFRLTGWKVHRTQDEGLYRLTSCFLPQEDRCLIFQPARMPSKGPASRGAVGFELQGGPMAQGLKELQGRLKEENGIPLFLAEAQLKLHRQHS